MKPSRKTSFLLLGLCFLLLSLVLPPPFVGMPTSAWKALGLALLMATWWTAESAPIPVTSLAPIVLAPFIGLATISEVTSAYAHPLIFLFLGGFLLSLAMEKCRLHQRIALLSLSFFGDQPRMQIAGIMLVTAFLSMWMSNTATAVMMLPIGLSVIALNKRSDRNGPSQTSTGFATALLLAIAYSANIGGVATLIGTPPNALMAAYLSSTFQIHIGFAEWMLLGLPLSMMMLVIIWLWLTRSLHNAAETTEGGIKNLVRSELKSLSLMSYAEKAVATLFCITALAWITRPLLEKLTGLAISDTGIVIATGILLFLIPSKTSEKHKDFLLNWEDTQKLPWGVLLLFGGGLALAGLINSTGLADYIATQIEQSAQIQPLLLLILVTTIIVFLTEVTSNTATTAAFLPLLGPISVSISDDPLLLTVPAAIAASCAFMLPVATPPNSVVFASGEIKISQMVRAGFMLNLLSILCVSILCYCLVGRLSLFSQEV